MAYCASKAKAITPYPYNEVLEIRSSLVFDGYHNTGHKDESYNAVKWTVSDLDVTLNVLAGSVAEVFGLLLDIVQRRLKHAREAEVAMQRE